jgi:ribosomal protein S18 acetylase RimI-like enzyme
MIILSCIEVEDQVVYDVFAEGYSDYSINFDMTMEDFVSRFLEIEASKEYSFVAFEDEKPVGMMLGGVQDFNGIKTMRCGGFAVIPNYRGKGIGKVLFNKHVELAKELGCKQLYLEVLKENKNAIRFYEGVGYSPVHDYRLYKNEEFVFTKDIGIDVVEVGFETIKDIRNTMPDLYIYWQGELFSLKKYKAIKYYVIYKDDRIIAALCMKDIGGIQFLWVDEAYRNRGYARAIVSHGLENLGLTKVYAVASNNFLYEGFLRKLGFEVEVEQYEMMQLVK